MSEKHIEVAFIRGPLSNAPHLRAAHDAKMDYADRMIDELEGIVRPATPAPPASFTFAAIRAMTGIADNRTWNKYAREVKVKPAKRGERNKKFSAAEVRNVLVHIIDSASESALREKCREALSHLQ
jgi:hypothetical protein